MKMNKKSKSIPLTTKTLCMSDKRKCQFCVVANLEG